MFPITTQFENVGGDIIIVIDNILPPASSKAYPILRVINHMAKSRFFLRKGAEVTKNMVS